MLKPLRCLKWYGSPNWLFWYLSPQVSAEFNKMTSGPQSWGAVKGRVTIVITKQKNKLYWGLDCLYKTNLQPHRHHCHNIKQISIFQQCVTLWGWMHPLRMYGPEVLHAQQRYVKYKMIKLINVALSALTLIAQTQKIYKTTYGMGPVPGYSHKRPFSCNAPGVPPIRSHIIQLSTSEWYKYWVFLSVYYFNPSGPLEVIIFKRRHT